MALQSLTQYVPPARRLYKRLTSMGTHVAMLTGDNRAAERITGELGIKTVFANVLPRDRLRRSESFKSREKGSDGRLRH